MSRIADALSKTSEARHVREVTTQIPVPWDFEETEPVARKSHVAQPRTERVERPDPADRADRTDRTDLRPVTAVALGPIDPRYAGKLVGSAGVTAAVAERYRQLAAALFHDARTSGARVIMVTSALPGEGKTLLASNLALTLSRSYRSRVLLIDGDLRRPSLHAAFGAPVGPGVSESIGDGVERPVPIFEVSPMLSLVVAGRAQNDPMRIVTSAAFQRLIKDSARDYDWVILDTPPVALLTDASLLASTVDKIIMVIKAGQTPYDAIQKAIENVGRDRILGTVLNESSAAHSYGPDYHTYYGPTDTASNP